MAGSWKRTAGTRGGAGRLAAMAIALALGLLLALAGQARAVDPAHFTPLGLAVEGGEAWRQSNDFDVFWTNPSGGQVVGASWRIYNKAGYDSGNQFTPGLGISELPHVRVPGTGEYTLEVWLRDVSGSEWPFLSAGARLRLDAVAPLIAFLPGGASSPPPPRLVALVADPLSGVAGGTISYRESDETVWSGLPSQLAAGVLGTELSAATPPLEPGVPYVFRAEARDAAGNVAETTVRADGAPMVLELPAAGSGAGAAGGGKRGGAADGRTRLRVRLRSRAREGGRWAASQGDDGLTVAAGEPVLLAGRLLGGDGRDRGQGGKRDGGDDGIAGRRLRIVSRPARGSRVGRTVATATTGPRGGFRLPLAPGPSRRISVAFAGGGGLDPARRQLSLRVRAAVSLQATPSRLRTGEVLRLSGRVGRRGARIPRPGKLVTISYRERRTDRWRPMIVTRTDRAGRFRSSYRFRYVSGRARILLRAKAPAEAAWPYAPGSSRPLAVEVRG